MIPAKLTDAIEAAIQLLDELETDVEVQQIEPELYHRIKRKRDELNEAYTTYNLHLATVQALGTLDDPFKDSPECEHCGRAIEPEDLAAHAHICEAAAVRATEPVRSEL